VPAAAVIPAPRAYMIVVAVKTCVVEAEALRRILGSPARVPAAGVVLFGGRVRLLLDFTSNK
jgi:hypothetical protein